MSIRIESRTPRENWRQRVEESGLLWHSENGHPYWSEDRNLVLSLPAAEILEAAANELHDLYIVACEEVVQRGWWERLAIPPHAVDLVKNSWSQREFSLLGRFDLAWDGTGQPKLLEYNADTPTSLIEAAIIQWEWLQDVAPESDQLNSVHEALVENWQKLPEQTVHFSCIWENIEDRQTIAYLAETAEQAGKKVDLLDMSEVGFSGASFTGLDEQPMENLFKLYPWEWLVREDFFGRIPTQSTRLIEPAWKMLLSNKGMLPILSELFPNHPLLLKSSLQENDIRQSRKPIVEKPFFSREGAGITIRKGVHILARNPPTEPGSPVIFQEHAELLRAGEDYVIWGLWMINDACHGLSARADKSPITGNLSRFLPHRLE